MSTCTVMTCNNRGVHRFPTDVNMKQQWIMAARINTQRRIGWYLRKYPSLCSSHFTPSDFILRGKVRALKRTAVPSIFPWTNVNIKIEDTGVVFSTSNSIAVNPGIKVKQEDSSLDENYEITFNPNNAMKNYTRPDLPINFVEEYPTLDIKATEEDIDPLQNNQDDEHAGNTRYSSTFPDQGRLEVTVKPSVDQDEAPKHHNIYLDQNLQIPRCDKSVQTDPFSETFLGSNENPFSVYKYKNSDKAINFYTGLETFKNMMHVFDTLGDCSHLNWCNESLPNKLDVLEQFFITLIILRRHTEFEEVAMLCLISVKEVSDIFRTWIRFMALKWNNSGLWVDIDIAQSHIPSDFYRQITLPGSKNGNTLKFLVRITTSGLITYISPCFGDSTADTDKLNYIRSNILHRYNSNNEITDDKNLNMQDIIMLHGIKENMLSSAEKDNLINNSESLITDRSVKSKRVHVKRIICMLKTYKILKQPMNKTEMALASDIAFVCAMLLNFRTNIGNKLPHKVL